MNPRLDLAEREIRELANTSVELMVEYYRDLPGRKVTGQLTAAELHKALDEPLPQRGMPAADILATVRDVIFAGSRHNGHPRFFGYVASPGNPVSATADLLASTLNSNVTSWRSGPATAKVEQVVIRWMKQIFGFPASSLGLLVSGGSIAHLSALAAARARAEPESRRTGMRPTKRALRIYISEEGHFSIAKAAAILGIGTDNVQAIPAGDDYRIDVGALEDHINDDLRAGHKPMCIVGNAGAVATGAVDPLDELARIAQRYSIWFHVDGAYGGFAALAPSARPLFAGIEQADSLAIDPHKWLYSSTGCGLVIYRDPAAASAAFSEDAEYTRTVGYEADEAFAFWDYGPELSRPFRALSVWMLLKYAGSDAIGAAIESNIRCAKYFETLIHKSGDFEMLAPVPLSIFCFRSTRGEDLNAANERLLTAIQRGGKSYVSNAKLKGRFALRGCVLNYRTTEADMDRLLEDVRSARDGAAGTT
jgi:glutamate/tyrosine decarboxylase-like PLP-dependent enzyme